MENLFLKANPGEFLTTKEKEELIERFVSSISKDVKKILLLPPDSTRKHAGIGELIRILYSKLPDKQIEIMPALGTHSPMSTEQLIDMFGEKIPLDRYLVHNWREDTVTVGVIPGTYVSEVSEGIVTEDIEVKINYRLVSGEYDLIISVGQVLPHAVIGMSNYSKNIFVGCGGEEMINQSHFIGGAYGLERFLGQDHSPVRKLFDYGEERFLKDIPLTYILTANTLDIQADTGITGMLGIFIGRERGIFEEALKLSQENNITYLEKPLKKVVVYLGAKFKSTWLANKAIYRTRMALADGGQLIIIAPGLKEFGEDKGIDSIIRKYGYSGKEATLIALENNEDLQEYRSAVGHLIRGSSDGRFEVTYACKQLSQEEIEGVNYNYMPLDEALVTYKPEKLTYGYNTLDNSEEVFFIDNPTTGLWIYEG